MGLKISINRLLWLFVDHKFTTDYCFTTPIIHREPGGASVEFDLVNSVTEEIKSVVAVITMDKIRFDVDGEEFLYEVSGKKLIEVDYG